jgi:hypothetical protein
MSRYAQFKVFSIVFGVIYTVCFYFNSVYPLSSWWAPIRYYPAIEQWHFERQPPDTAGPAILWYAWLAEALIASLVISLIVPRKVADRISLVYEKRWFF